MVFLVASLLVLVGLVVAVILGRTGGVGVHLARPAASAGGVGLPDGPVTGESLSRVRFDTGFRGYRTDQVDAVIDALVARLDELERERDTIRPDGPRSLR